VPGARATVAASSAEKGSHLSGMLLPPTLSLKGCDHHSELRAIGATTNGANERVGFGGFADLQQAGCFAHAAIVSHYRDQLLATRAPEPAGGASVLSSCSCRLAEKDAKVRNLLTERRDSHGIGRGATNRLHETGTRLLVVSPLRVDATHQTARDRIPWLPLDPAGHDGGVTSPRSEAVFQDGAWPPFRDCLGVAIFHCRPTLHVSSTGCGTTRDPGGYV
jgi:hypothetical protein